MYTINYDPFTGKPCSIQNGNMSIPLCEGNTDYQAFLLWNKTQKTPLDLNSTIEVVKPVTPRDLGKELDALKADHTSLKAEVAALKTVAK